MTQHTFVETIAGRAYHIEVVPACNRWRAQLRRLPGMPTAMMPFYGGTPEEAAALLVGWLALAHRRQAAVATPPADGPGSLDLPPALPVFR